MSGFIWSCNFDERFLWISKLWFVFISIRACYCFMSSLQLIFHPPEVAIYDIRLVFQNDCFLFNHSLYVFSAYWILLLSFRPRLWGRYMHSIRLAPAASFSNLWYFDLNMSRDTHARPSCLMVSDSTTPPSAVEPVGVNSLFLVLVASHTYLGSKTEFFDLLNMAFQCIWSIVAEAFDGFGLFLLFSRSKGRRWRRGLISILEVLMSARAC